MADGTLARLAGPAFLAAAAADIFAVAANTYVVIKQIHVVNQAASGTLTFNLFVGATGGSAAGTEVAFLHPCTVGTPVDLYFPNGLRLSTTDFLSGLASGASDLVITVLGTKYAA